MHEDESKPGRPRLLPASGGRRAPRSGARWVVWLQRPLVSLVLFLAVSADVLFVFRAYTWSGTPNNATTTAIPWHISRHLLGLKVPDIEFSYPWSSYFVREGDAYRDLDSIRTSADELTKLLASRPGDVIEIRRTRFLGRRGWWAPTRTLREHRLKITRMSDGASLDKDLAARSAYGGTMFGKRDPELSRLLLRDIEDQRPIWSGYIHNLATLLALILLAISMGWVPRMWGAGRRRRLLERSICPACAYDLSATKDLAGVKTCPECGTRWVLASYSKAS